jgi:hypothetical protein
MMVSDANSSVTLLEASFTLLEDNYRTGRSHKNDCSMLYSTSHWAFLFSVVTQFGLILNFKFCSVYQTTYSDFYVVKTISFLGHHDTQHKGLVCDTQQKQHVLSIVI